MTYITDWRKTFNGLVYHSLQRQRKRKHNVGYTKEEFFNWAKRSRRLKKLYKEWVSSNYKLELRPTFDRKNPLNGYTLTNIQVITYLENVRKGNKELIRTKGKKVKQFDLSGKLINEFNSIKEAGIKTGYLSSNICNALKGRYKTYKFYVWKYG